MFDHSNPLFRRQRYSVGVFLLLTLVLASAVAQSSAESGQQTRQLPGTGVTVQQQQPAPPKPPQPKSTPAEQQQPITKAQAKELFRSVDEILQFVSQDTGLPIKHKVKRKLITRQQVERYVEGRLKDDKDAQRLERSELVLKKFGMVPDGYNLHAQFLKLLSEQVAAYYDAKTKTVNLLDWVQPDLQRPVLAHELTHALQDQSIDLRTWMRAGGSDGPPLPDQQEQVVEEAQAARENVAEGQAMVAMLDYILAPAGSDVLKAPDTVNAMRASMTDNKDQPELTAAPTYLRESLLMPYTFGLDLVRTVLVKRGKAATYGGMLEHPPADTLQVMVPENYLDDKAALPLSVPDLDKLISPNYERYDFGGMGAFDIYLLAKQYAPDKDAKQYYSHWRGGYYLAPHLKSAPKDKIGLIYVSRWDSPEAARAFATLYFNYSPKRYKLPPVTAPGASVGEDGSDEVMGMDFKEQGQIVVQVHDKDVLIMEGLENSTMDRIREAVLPASSHP
jgi:hypothetical protein